MATRFVNVDHAAPLLFTDGLYELEGANQTHYDMERLVEAVHKGNALPTEAFCEQPTIPTCQWLRPGRGRHMEPFNARQAGKPATHWAAACAARCGKGALIT